MASPEPYELTSTWHVQAPRERVWRVFESVVDDPDPFAWWPDLQVVSREDDVLHLVTRSALGYRLRFRLSSLRTRPPDMISFDATGDLTGRGVVRLAASGDADTVVQIIWTVALTRSWMRRTDRVLRPFFRGAHGLAMRRGQRALQAWISEA